MAAPRVCLSVVSELFKGQQFWFDGGQPISIGRTPENMVALDHKSVSRRHARIEPNGSGAYRLVDLGSHNGTRVGSQLVSEHVLRPGDVIGLGEVALVFLPDTAEGAALPAVVPGPETQTAPLARPLTFEEIYAQAAATPTVAVAKPRRARGPLLYGATVAVVVALGSVGVWFAGRHPVGPPTIAVQLRVGEVLPVNVAWCPDPAGRGLIEAIGRVEEIGQPDDERVAFARKTKFRTYVTIHGRALGTTDIPVHGPRLGRLVVRVLVRGVKPESEAEVWMGKPVDQRRKHARMLLQRAATFQRSTGSADENTWKVIHDLDLAARLLEAIPDEVGTAAEAAERARTLRQALDERFDQLARRIDVLFTEGKYRDCELAARELVGLFGDKETEEYYIVRSYLEGLADEVARAEREAQARR